MLKVKKEIPRTDFQSSFPARNRPFKLLLSIKKPLLVLGIGGGRCFTFGESGGGLVIVRKTKLSGGDSNMLLSN